ncbi:hypothetical protein AVEN_120134-1 [Araneus ventricosus]|uniref:Uncharacterized protein n=1 Tax=Araneus ventricosus TaxID=182803 RepID=A0A4Y2MHW2_ARAVE|nr:hypothetical protein AVEN_120134-1 [Araneus ventricosus]
MKNFVEHEFSSDIDLTENYRDQWVAMKIKVDLILSTNEENDEISSAVNETKRNFRLPKLELKRFDGDTKNWLGFWGQLKKIMRMIVSIEMTCSSFFCKQQKLVHR